eukprot:4104591-Pyramimonas_sp.AAC.1
MFVPALIVRASGVNLRFFAGVQFSDLSRPCEAQWPNAHVRLAWCMTWVVTGLTPTWVVKW